MAYTAADLVSKAYYLSGIVGRNLEVVSGQQLSDGVALLNALLGFKSAQSRLIPYWKRDGFTAVVNQESYFIQNLIEIEYLTFNIGEVRYSMLETSRRKYFGTGRVDNISSLPFNWRLERELDGSRIYMYFLPNQAYPVQYSGKFALTNVSFNTDLLGVYDEFYIEYLRYELAKMICDENDIEMTMGKVQRLKEYREALLDISPPDLTMQKMSTLQAQRGLNWADVNLGLGWRPS